MAGINKAILIGNLGRDPEMRYTASGLAVANFNLATTERVKDEDKTEWHRIVAFGKLAEIIGNYLQKGRQVYIEGRIQTRQWEDKEGNKRYTTEIVANTMQMLGPKQGGGGGGQGNWGQQGQGGGGYNQGGGYGQGGGGYQGGGGGYQGGGGGYQGGGGGYQGGGQAGGGYQGGGYQGGGGGGYNQAPVGGDAPAEADPGPGPQKDDDDDIPF